jgi:hypothetical protein
VLKSGKNEKDKEEKNGSASAVAQALSTTKAH